MSNNYLYSSFMSLLFGVELGVWIGTGVVIAIALIGFMVKTWWTLWHLTTNRATWKGGLDQWKKGIDDWRNSVDNRFDKLAENTTMLRDVETIIKSTLWNLVITNGMVQRHSPLVPSKQAIEILEELNIISEVNANTSLAPSTNHQQNTNSSTPNQLERHSI